MYNKDTLCTIKRGLDGNLYFVFRGATSPLQREASSLLAGVAISLFLSGLFIWLMLALERL